MACLGIVLGNITLLSREKVGLLGNFLREYNVAVARKKVGYDSRTDQPVVQFLPKFEL